MQPSEDLADEIEAVNSIYGDGTLVLTEAGGGGGGGDSDNGYVAVLAVPAAGEDDVGAADGAHTVVRRRLHLRLCFPPAYPAGPGDAPAVLGVQSVGDRGEHRRPGAAARDAERFRNALGATFQAGQVCLFDAIEAFLQSREEEEEAEEAEEEDNEGKTSSQADTASETQAPASTVATSIASFSTTTATTRTTTAAAAPPPPPFALAGPPPWTVADPIVELKSTFVARCAPVTSPAQAAAYVQHLLDTDRRVRGATHNMTAWRIRQDAVVYQDCDDDGETAAGGRLLHLLQLMDLWNVLVVVTRWYGGHKLGPRRFALINQAARDAVVKAGFVAEPAKKKGQGKSSK
ncbi:impact family protein [Niveomyces insectorum RCEF 264]|uniref:Impact family protein n=1 Tax=Niveomyces insectorum RCEF 264 TaxID=1081102 RepID=A0A168AF21_9HYPO|nr:impact family protein [Niveomyces insectorum RCEF 264]